MQESLSFYEVRGRDEAQLASSLAREAPPHGGYRVYGLTRWSLKWDYGMRRSATGCRIVRPRVDIDLETVLPRWPEREGAEVGLAGRWRRFEAAVRRHEAGHRALVAEAGGRIVRDLAGLRSLSCTLLVHDADEEARAIVDEAHARNVAYDRRTLGGRLQGVRWP